MRRRGLTLLELLVVLTILIALATIVVPVVSTFGRKSQDVATRENLLRLQDLLVNQYIPDMGGNVYIGPSANPYKGTNVGNMAANLPAPGALGSAASARNTFHPQLRYLFVNPDDSQYPETMTWKPGLTALSARRWQGPYVRHAGGRYQIHDEAASPPDGIDPSFTSVYGQNDDPTVLDAWGRPIVIQVPTTADPGTHEPGVNFTRLVSAGADGRIDTLEAVTMPTTADRNDDIVIFLFCHDPYGDGIPKLEP